MVRRLIFIVAAGLLLSSCTSKEEIARLCAESFLSSYYSLRFSEAEAFCTQEYGALLEESVKDMDALPEYVLGKMKEASEETSFEILSTDAESVKGEASVVYNLYASGLEKPLQKVLRLKIEGDSALVYAVE